MFRESHVQRLQPSVIVSGGFFVFLLLVCWMGCGTSPFEPVNRWKENALDQSGPRLSAEMQGRVEAFCGDCHALPRPESFARDRWHFEVRRGYEFYATSGRNDLDPPPLQSTLAYFRARAPKQLSFPLPQEAVDELPVRFQQEKFYLNSNPDVLPEIAFLRWATLVPKEESVLLASDMRHGQVVAIDLKRSGRAPPRVLAQLRNPCRVEVCDLDDDGETDLVVADLGSYLPSDHDRGRVVWLQKLAATDSYRTVELQTGLGRVADVRATDADGDGKLDLIVAEFGWRQTGRLLLLHNASTPDNDPRFVSEVMDDRPGTLDVRVHDFNGDGRPDIAALFSQEFESIDVFLNGRTRGTGPQFAHYNLFTGPDLTFGSTGIELVDLNDDGMMDIVATNGDTFDNDYASPGHGVQWLENRGKLDFVYHRLTELPGAYRALPGDFDQDGKLDILAVARLPPNLKPGNVHATPLASIVLLRQTESGRFVRHTLEWGAPYYPTVGIGDFDRNGRLDFAVAAGPYVAEMRKARKETHYLTVWWNQDRRNN